MCLAFLTKVCCCCSRAYYLHAACVQPIRINWNYGFNERVNHGAVLWIQMTASINEHWISMNPYQYLLAIPIDATDELINLKDVPVIFQTLCVWVRRQQGASQTSQLALACLLFFILLIKCCGKWCYRFLTRSLVSDDFSVGCNAL